MPRQDAIASPVAPPVTGVDLRQATIGGRPVALCEPYCVSGRPDSPIGLEAEMRMIVAAWMHSGTPELFGPLLVGPPGVGKTSLVLELAFRLGKPVYTVSGNRETRVEDIVCGAWLPESSRTKLRVEYLLQPLTTALLKGGIFFFDEIGRASAAVHDELLSVLDRRRYVEIQVLAERVNVHPDFRFVAATNTVDLYGMEESLLRRLRPRIHVDYPTREHAETIVSNAFQLDGLEKLLDMFWLLWRERVSEDRWPSGRELVDVFALACRLRAFEQQDTSTPLQCASPGEPFTLEGDRAPDGVTAEHVRLAFEALGSRQGVEA